MKGSTKEYILGLKKDKTVTPEPEVNLELSMMLVLI